MRLAKKIAKNIAKNKQSLLENDLTFTVCGEWFPLPGDFSRYACIYNDENPLDAEMRLFGSCTRFAFNRLLEGKTREDLKRELQPLYSLNSRYVDDAIMKAKAIIESQKKLLTQEIQDREKKLARAKRKLAKAEKYLNQAIDTGDETIIKVGKLTAQGRIARVNKLTAEISDLKSHHQNGTIPPVVFGGRALWRKVCKGRATNEEWRQTRQNRLYARGDESKGGNPNIKLDFYDGEFFLAVTISHLSEQTGIDTKGRPIMSHAPRVAGKLWLPEKYRLKIWDLILSGAAYTVELIKGSDSRYRAHIVFSAAKPVRTTGASGGYLGMDTNPDGVALANVDSIGQPAPWPADFTVPYPQGLHKICW